MDNVPKRLLVHVTIDVSYQRPLLACYIAHIVVSAGQLVGNVELLAWVKLVKLRTQISI